jgi:hypothetical protein
MMAHRLGHFLPGENDSHVSLFQRAIDHLLATAQYAVYYGEGRDSYDLWGRTAHESVFNPNDGNYRCPNSQQGYSGFTTWTRGLAWAMLGFAEELEFLHAMPAEDFECSQTRDQVMQILTKGARATCDFYIAHTPSDGIPYWDTGAPGLVHLKDYLSATADPFNEFEPVDSSAAAIGSQGLLRLGHFFNAEGNTEEGNRYWQAGLTVASRLMDTPYLSVGQDHQGILLHSVYHRPNGWDFIPEGQKIPCNESSMWGDYHMREMALYLHRILSEDVYYTFFNGLDNP